MFHILYFIFFFFNDTATTEIYTLSLHDALPIFDSPTPRQGARRVWTDSRGMIWVSEWNAGQVGRYDRSEEHTSELQSQSNLVCRLLLEKKKKKNQTSHIHIVSKHSKQYLHVYGC